MEHHRTHRAERPHPAADPAQAGRIVASARRHFFTHGFRSVTMDDLANELGMSKKTLYASFPSKVELLRAVLLDKFRSVETDLESLFSARSSDVLTALQRLLACMQHHTGEIQPAFVRDIRREAPDMFKLIEARRRRIIERHFGRLFEAGRRSGVIRKDISTRLMTAMLVGLTEAIVNPGKLAELGLTPQSGYNAVVAIILEGLLTRKASSRAATMTRGGRRR
jgi:AcrR family transcriptional regulator